MLRNFPFYTVFNFLLIIMGTSPLYAATTYYVSSTGGDSNAGTSEQRAWKSLDKVNQGIYRSGDRILFEGGKPFNGTLLFHPDNLKSTAQLPVIIGSYGKERATLNGDPASGGIFAVGVGGVTIRNINIVGKEPDKGGAGISFTQEKGHTISGIQITDVEISGFQHGVQFLTGEIPAKIKDVRIERARVHDNAIGIAFYGHLTLPAANSGDDYAMSNVAIRHCQLFHNTGFGVQDCGAALAMMNIKDAVVENNRIHDNGGDHVKPGGYANGPSAITVYDGHNMKIQRNEIYHQHVDPDGPTDNAGIDIWATDSVVQYNYVHDNEGWGMTLGAGNPKDPKDPYKWPSERNTIRYNIFENNARRLPDSKDTPELRGAQLLMFGPIKDFAIYNNTFYARNPGATRKASRSKAPRPPEHTGSDDDQAMIWIMPYKPGGRGLRFSNNIFIAGDHVRFIDLYRNMTGNIQVSFLNNAYLGGSPREAIKWGDASYDNVNIWSKATGQEKWKDTFVAKTGDASFHLQAPGKGGIASYRLKKESSLIDTGLDLKAAFGGDIGKQDFLGAPVSSGKTVDLGALEYSQGAYAKVE